jgi:hypothetical protein
MSGCEGIEAWQMPQPKADRFAHVPSDDVLGGLSSGDAPAREDPLIATVCVVHQEHGVPVLNDTLHAEGLRPHETPGPPEHRRDHLDERSFAHSTSDS